VIQKKIHDGCVDYREETRSGRAHGIANRSFVAEVLSSWCCSHSVLELS
jgi:hypothetical protein